MKKLFPSIVAIAIISLQAISQPVNNQSGRKVQVAILFDTSNSMDGLIDQAKTRIWSIINELSSLRFLGQTPLIEIALYDYGNSGLTAGSGYIRQQIALTTDLDVISAKLFGLSTNGGDEFCGAVIQKSMQELAWSNSPLDLKIIYIAGNEPFNQGTVAYKEVCNTAASKNIYVNTIYCGNHAQGIAEFWRDCATISKGDYFNIDSDQTVVQIATPYDNDINQYNDSLNKTYYGYGSLGNSKKINQIQEDANAESQSPSSKTERSIVKSKEVYSNASWDIIDAVDKEGKDITKMAEDELPIEFKGKTAEEKTALIEEKKKERTLYQEKINTLAKNRQDFIAEEMKKQADGVKKDDFGTSVNESLLKKATELGYNKE
ncbi:MAG: hypothetical protein RI883_1410 [Bacteroidota bacterium]|jgi:hypothetical protein